MCAHSFLFPLILGTRACAPLEGIAINSSNFLWHSHSGTHTQIHAHTHTTSTFSFKAQPESLEKRRGSYSASPLRPSALPDLSETYIHAVSGLPQSNYRFVRTLSLSPSLRCCSSSRGWEGTHFTRGAFHSKLGVIINMTSVYPSSLFNHFLYFSLFSLVLVCVRGGGDARDYLSVCFVAGSVTQKDR